MSHSLIPSSLIQKEFNLGQTAGYGLHLDFSELSSKIPYLSDLEIFSTESQSSAYKAMSILQLITELDLAKVLIRCFVSMSKKMTYVSLIHTEYLKQYPNVFKWNDYHCGNNENILIIVSSPWLNFKCSSYFQGLENILYRKTIILENMESKKF